MWLRTLGSSGGAGEMTIDNAAGTQNILFSGDDNAVSYINTGGSFGIGTASPSAKAILDLTSTTKGFLPPRMTATQASAITSPPDGLLLYVTDTNGTFTAVGFWGRTSGVWTQL